MRPAARAPTGVMVNASRGFRAGFPVAAPADNASLGGKRAARKATMTTIGVARAKALAKLLRGDLAAAGITVTHSLALELVAHQHGARDWNVLAGSKDAGPRPAWPDIAPGVPVLRVMSVEAALRFYVGHLGFTVDWRHQFEPGTPWYVQVSRSGAVLHLSEHHGDGSPHGVVWFPVADVYALHDELLSRPGAAQRPGVDADAPGGPTMQLIDPYGNVLRFAQREQT
ncbi:glyoxalase [Amorphoplanes auranticolor]|uniref:Bleomycin resistance protein n=2 Tax=Actinoplanes auranticolor TaxID=47988 RepID=A0A919SRC5_9ACTN|nr:glyoxalase [Actinoplanes auranticolor]